ncbi:hypothetical protein THAOC_10592 [Thalassiosira oceanica]|uniref:DDE Tnp4 domain-containing protein n=1 Tax=Thalassiosira oceanica TaxID=159749 RepID=K0SPN6_THAOC|nr:hypothetical protein THAOC_10592 [Thalassiosira oceanica]|eukprot:EJK68248.1 hypothetical protein THAOC_10592 [Thalassiosira oceanica]
MTVFAFDLKEIRTATEMASKLSVGRRALDYVNLSTEKTCKTCAVLPAALTNQNRCILCRQGWYPRLHGDDGERLEQCRGHKLYGPEFGRVYRGKVGKTCCCESEVCEGIGYSHQGMIRLPSEESQCVEFLRLLGIQSSRRRCEMAKDHRNHRVAHWHFHPEHKVLDQTTGMYTIKRLTTYKDGDNRVHQSLGNNAPPNYKVERYVDEITLSDGYRRGGYDDKPPSWLRHLARLQQTNDPRYAIRQAAPTPRRGVSTESTWRSASKVARVSTTKKAPRGKRMSPDQEESYELLQKNVELRALLKEREDELNGVLKANGKLRATIELKEDELVKIKIKLDHALRENESLRNKIKNLEARLKENNSCLSYDDLKPGGKLTMHVKDFTFFPNFKCNDVFLDFINYSDGRPKGDGMCENMARYHHISVDDRKKYQQEKKTKETQCESEDDDMSVSSDAGTGLEDVLMAEPEADKTSDPRGRPRKLHWKTEWLVYCFYVRCNISLRRTAALFGIGPTLVHDIVYSWACMLCESLGALFPVPTRSQMLRAYPLSVIKAFGHAKIFMMLDATEITAQVASMKTVNSILYSAYKHNSTLKWLVGCDAIGTVWNESITDANGGAISDPIQTTVTRILEDIPFGCAVEVDKGFMIDNDCALLGIMCMRPQKFIKHQQQQSKEDVAGTQKIGNTRITIEQVNGQMKISTNFFDKRIKILQIGLADKIFRSSYLLTNFKLGFIQGRVVQTAANGKPVSQPPRPCKAEIR